MNKKSHAHTRVQTLPYMSLGNANFQYGYGYQFEKNDIPTGMQ